MSSLSLDDGRLKKGKLIGVTGQSVARWEKEEFASNDSAESLIRILYLDFAHEPGGVRELLLALEEQNAQVKNDAQLFELDGAWKPKLAA